MVTPRSINGERHMRFKTEGTIFVAGRVFLKDTDGLARADPPN